MSCPSGFHCAVDNTCWHIGQDPIFDLSIPDLAVAIATDSGVDHGVSFDMLVDFGATDLAPALKHQGEACRPVDTCDTGQCVDGYCCNSLCTNNCQACNVTGQLGICSNIGLGATPVGARSCAAQAATTCGLDGKCDGQGACRDWPSGTHCTDGTCEVATGNFTNPSTCNGTGTCVSNGSGNCAPYNCQDTTQCYQSCSGTPQCSGSNTCVGTSCGQLPDGRQCAGGNGALCLNGNCVDGRCCNTACGSACQACDVPGSLGICTTVGLGSPHGMRTCANPGTTCGGSCDGKTATCSYPDNTTACGSTCSSGLLQNSACDSLGNCQSSSPKLCTGNFACIGSACLTSCGANTDCAPSATYGCTSTGALCKNFCLFDTDHFDNGCIYAP